MTNEVQLLGESVKAGMLANSHKPLFAGAGIVISDKPLPEERPEYTVVVSRHAVAISSVIYSLMDICRDGYDYLNKFEFFGRLAEAANAYQAARCDDPGIVLAVLAEGVVIAGEMDEIAARNRD